MKKFIIFFLNSNINEIEIASEKTSFFLKSYGLPHNEVREQVMIVEELLKTCMQYSSFGSSQEKMRVQIEVSKDKIIFEVSSPINGIQKRQLEELDKTIQFIHGYQDPFEAFLKLKAASGNGSNGLALAKLSHEGKTTIDFFVGEDNIINIVAVRSKN
jgi:hypothetical protein